MTKKELKNFDINLLLRDLSMGVTIPEICYFHSLTKKDMQHLASRSPKLATYVLKDIANTPDLSKKTQLKPHRGRPFLDNKRDEVVEKLKKAFSIGCTITEATLMAGISKPAYYDLLKREPDLAEVFIQLKSSPQLQARTKVVKDLKNNVETAKWYLRNKHSDEFGKQTPMTHIITTPELEEQKKKRVENLLNREFDETDS